MKRIIFPVLLLSALFVASTVRAQTPNYYGALLYSEQNDTSVPPIYAGQPSSVTAAYLWIDDAMRLYSGSQILAYIQSLSTWNDTTQTLASYLYQIQDDNPLTYYNWDDAGIYPHPYKGDPSQSVEAFLRQLLYFGGQSTRALLSSEIVADITVSDTVCKTNPIAITSKDMVLVNCVINDEIKGKWVPACSESPRSGKKGSSSLGLATAYSAYPPDTASPGTCLQFEYSPEWKKNANNDMSSPIGWWVKPGQEYIVFLNFMGVGYNSTQGFFSTYPVGSFGHCCGMYPVVGGIVQDPNDDLYLGGTNLTVADWKSRLRAKIATLIAP